MREKIRIRGTVQGVGFRPHAYRVAKLLNLGGYVLNDSEGVILEVEGEESEVGNFGDLLISDLPAGARVTSIEQIRIPTKGERTFAIKPSLNSVDKAVALPPDIATCPECLKELFDPADRRYRYPFINCTHCGPRFTIVEDLPYDRPGTSMSQFVMCARCRREYENPNDRRFHAQPIACPDCGPVYTLTDGAGKNLCGDSIKKTIERIKEGAIVAIKGIGGFHLAINPFDQEAIQKLRKRKCRYAKPLALMAEDLAFIELNCVVTIEERELLTQLSRPIVLLQRRETSKLPAEIAPGNNHIGFMLPYAPIHYLLLGNDLKALVMTSGNVSDEPMAISNREALVNLSGVADFFLIHNRDIIQRCDDSVVWLNKPGRAFIRRSRGFVPAPIHLSHELRQPVLACGGELKNTVALGKGDRVYLSQHIGDLEHPSSYNFFEESVNHLKKLTGIEPELIACDLHPEYFSSQWAEKQDLPVMKVQHHHAHFASVLAENRVTERAIGIILDGSGWGCDGTIWGGEVLIGSCEEFTRYAYLSPVRMPGGAIAVTQPWRMALAYLKHSYGDEYLNLPLPLLKSISSLKLQQIDQMLCRHLNSPLTSSCGRLFDGVAALLNIRQEVDFEAQAAVALETLASTQNETKDRICYGGPWMGMLDTRPLIKQVVGAVVSDRSAAEIAFEFHRSLASLFVASAIQAREESEINYVALSGGVFQNRLFLEMTYRMLEERKFAVLTNHEAPCNDGGLALGQVVAADAAFRQQERLV